MKIARITNEEYLLYFNGTDRAVTIANTNNRLQPSDTFTWEMWFKLDGYTQYNTLMGFNANNLDFGRMDSVNNFRFHIYDSEGSQQFLRPTNIPNVNDEAWHHIAISWDNVNGTKFCLIDGIIRDEGIVPIGTRIRDMSTQSTFTIGGASPTNRLIKGWIKDVRMWNVARTQEEILADMSSKLIGDEDGLFLYLPLDEGEGETVVDKASGFEVNINDATWQRDTTTLGNLKIANEIIEYPKELEGGRNLVVLSDIVNPTKVEVTDTGWIVRDSYSTILNYNFYEKLEPNTEYTVSYEMEIIEQGDTTNTYPGRLGVSRPSPWLLITFGNSNTPKVVDSFITDDLGDLRLTCYGSLGGVVEYKNVKIEKGNKVTPWTPAPEDLGLEYPDDINHFTTSFRNNGSLLVGEIIKMEPQIYSKNFIENGNYEYGEIEPWIVYNGAQLSWDEEVGAYLFQGRADRNDLAYQELTLEPHTVYTLSLIRQRNYGNTSIRILRSLDGEDYIADIALIGTSLAPTSTTFLTEGQTQYYISFASTAINRRGYAKEIQLEKSDIASEYVSYGEVWVEDEPPLMRFKDGKVYIKGELIEGGV